MSPTDMRICSLTQEQQARFGEWAQRWIDIGLSTEPADFDAATTAAITGYQLANCVRPMVILRVGSPYVATVGGAMAWMILQKLKLSGNRVWDRVGDQVWDQVRAQVRAQVGDQVGAQVWNQVGDQVGDQVGAQVWDQVWNQIWDQVGDQVWGQIGDQVWAQVRAQVGDQVRAQVWDRVWNQVGDQVGAQVWDQVWNQIWDQVGDQVRDQVRDQVLGQIGDQVWGQIGDQVWDKVWDQVGAQVWNQIWDQVGDQVWGQIGDQVWAQVRAQVGDQVGAQVWAQVRDQVGDQVGEQVGEIWPIARAGINNYGYDAVFGTGFVAWVSYFRDVCGWQNALLEKFDVLETLVKSCGWTWWHKDVLAISDRPRVINRDERGRLHSLTGPAIVYPDGWAIHAVHGVRVPAWIIEQPEKITPQLITDERNVEIRRVMLERFGADRFIKESGAIIVDKCGMDHPIVGLRTATLYRKDMNDDEPIYMLDMLNSTPEPDGTTKRYMIRVDPNAYGGISTCLAAIASTYRMPDGSMLFKHPEDYVPSAES